MTYPPKLYNTYGKYSTMNFEYYKSALNAAIIRHLSIMIGRGWIDELASQLADEINTILGKTVVTPTDIKNYFTKLYQYANDKIPQNGYYDSRIPRTHRLILRDKLFYSVQRVSSELIKFIKSKYENV